MIKRIRNWFFTPIGALVWFGAGYLIVILSIIFISDWAGFKQ